MGFCGGAEEFSSLKSFFVFSKGGFRFWSPFSEARAKFSVGTISEECQVRRFAYRTTFDWQSLFVKRRERFDRKRRTRKNVERFFFVNEESGCQKREVAEDFEDEHFFVEQRSALFRAVGFESFP